MNFKRDARDDFFSKLIRCRVNWQCERCGKTFDPNEPKGTMGLDCSHLFGRRRRSVRWHPQNAVAHCTPCHMWLSEQPREFSRWIIAHLGSECADVLEARANTLVKWSKADLEEIRIQLRDAWKDMEARRDAGETGRIEFSIPFVEDL